MSPGDRDDQDQDYDVDQPRSIFAALWFRVVLVVVVVGVVAALAVPYVLEWMSPPPAKTTAAAAKPAVPVAKAPAPAAPAAAPPPPAPIAPERKEAPAPPLAAKTPALEDKPAKPAQPAKVARKEVARRPAKAAAKASAATGGAYFVQVGAFKDAEHARKLAARLREGKFRVEESTAGAGADTGAARAPGAADTYDVFVSGGAIADINAKLAAKGLATTTTPNGVVVKPSLPLRDAVALSKDLAVEGLKVQVRRAGGSGPAASAGAPARAVEASDGIYRVRVGPFADRAAAAEALNALREKGYKDSFIARGGA